MRLAGERAKPRQRGGAAQIVQKFLRLLGSNFQRAGEPAAQRAIEQRIADEKHEEHGEQRQSHRADDHLGLETRTELFFAALRPKAQHRAHENHEKYEKCCGDETGNRVKR